MSVVNLDDSEGNGTHFVCYVNLPNHKHVYYFDSFGVLPPQEIVKYLKSSGKSLLYNSSQYQPIESVLCGWYCCHVLIEMHNGSKFYDVLSKFDMNDPNENDKMMKNYFSKYIN